MLRVGNAKQALRRHVTCSARSLYLVAAQTDCMATCSVARSIPDHFGACERVDDLGTEISCKRNWAGMGADRARAFDHRRKSDMVLPRQTILASSAHLHLSEVGDSFITMDGLSTVGGRVSWSDSPLVTTGKSGA